MGCGMLLVAQAKGPVCVATAIGLVLGPRALFELVFSVVLVFRAVNEMLLGVAQEVRSRFVAIGLYTLFARFGIRLLSAVLLVDGGRRAVKGVVVLCKLLWGQRRAMPQHVRSMVRRLSVLLFGPSATVRVGCSFCVRVC